MLISEKDMEVLKKCGENKTRVVVSGANGLGQKFCTEGNSRLSARRK